MWVQGNGVVGKNEKSNSESGLKAVLKKFWKWIKRRETSGQAGREPRDREILVEDEIISMEIDGALDLHTFHPKDIKSLVPDYLEECQKRGILDVRVIHGKGTGTLRRIVHSILEKHPSVVSFRLGGHGSGGWGATLVRLRAIDEDLNTP